MAELRLEKSTKHIPCFGGYTLSPSPLAQEEKLSVGEMSCVDRLHIFTQLSGFPQKMTCGCRSCQVCQQIYGCASKGACGSVNLIIFPRRC
jgi:hypothetical protein